MAKPATRCDTSDKSDALHVITNAGATLPLLALLDLTAISGKPKWSPQKTTLYVDGAPPVDGVIVLVDEKGVSHTIPVPFGAPLVLTRPFRQVSGATAGSTDVNAIFEWFDPTGSTEWNL